jgi:pimeloyl-ACP methyl ester carboxylesterase
MSDEPRVHAIPIRGGRIEAFTLRGGPGVPLLVLGGVETGLRPLAGTENVLLRRWTGRTRARTVVVLGRPLPADASRAEAMMHPRVIADAVSVALAELGRPVAIEAESGGGRISLWLAVDHPELVARMSLASVASETPPASPMHDRMQSWIAMGEAGQWGEFFARLAVEMKPAGSVTAEAFAVAARFQPRPATPERFLGELKATLDSSSFVTDRLSDVDAPTLVLAGGQDQIVPVASSRLVADSIPGARFAIDPESGHTVRSSFTGYDELVEVFLADGDA